MIKLRLLAGFLLLLPIFTMASEVNQSGETGINQQEATEKVQPEVAEKIQPEETENEQAGMIIKDQGEKSKQVQPDITISGVVWEKGTRRPLENVQVALKGKKIIFTTTDVKGRFVFTVVKENFFTLNAFSLGYLKSRDFTVMPADNKPIKLKRIYLESAAMLSDVLVYADRNPDKVAKISVTGKELEAVAGTGGDPLRGLQTLPGITVTNDGSASPAIRGSSPGDNQYYADFIPVDYLFHFGGAVSVFNADLIEDLNLYASAYGAEYGDVLGGVIDVKLRDPRNDRLGVKINTNLFLSDILIEGPTAKNQSFYLAARRSYYDLILPKTGQLGDGGTEYTRFPAFSDYQGKYLWRPNSRSKISLQLNGAKDEFKFFIPDTAEDAEKDPDFAGTNSMTTRYDSQAIVWSQRLSTENNNKLAIGHSYSTFDQKAGAVGTSEAIFNSYYLRDALSIEATDNHRLLLGVDYTRTAVKLNLDFKDPKCTEFDPSCDFTSAQRVSNEDTVNVDFYNIYAKDRWRVTEAVTGILGVRGSYDTYLEEVFTEPRLGLEWKFWENMMATAGWGKYHQFPDGVQVLDQFGNPDLSNLSAEHYVLGLGQEKKADWQWKVEGFYKNLDKLVIADPVVNYNNGGEGRAYGVDFFLKKDLTERFNGWASFTWSRSERENQETGEIFPASVDQPYNLKLVGNYKITSQWTFGAKWLYHSGSPYTPVVGSTLRPLTTDQYLPIYGDLNSSRLPAYHKLDLRLDRDFIYNTWKLNTYLEIINVYNQKNVADYSYNNDYSVRDPVYQLPRLISIGIQAAF